MNNLVGCGKETADEADVSVGGDDGAASESEPIRFFVLFLCN